jgi:di/tricarboxylate transporter
LRDDNTLAEGENEASEEVKLAEILILPQSDLVGRTLRSTRFLQTYGVTVVAIHRHGQSLRDKIGYIRLRLGDLLLVQGPVGRLKSLYRSSGLLLLEELDPALITNNHNKKKKGLFSLIILVVAVIVAGLGWLPLSIVFLSAAVLVILTGCISLEEVYQFIEWRLIILIGGMTAFGVAMEKTGAAEFLANWIVFALEPLGVMAILAGLFILTVLLTQPLSNAAAALVTLPVGLQVAQRLDLNGRPFAVAIMFAASISLVTPFEPSCLLVYGLGKYKFMDFIKTGAGLTVLLMLLALFLVPVFWPF